ncbi:MAG: hypothetical protein IPF39_02685 [Comamonadaceae bacterium]|uniref:hypothetical protein n=1 Tax=Candidatus Skiveiella danica TaxID=3386177 RepID=UPI003908F85D|nr:hypothetical protein [Comamonadaceae bacterium]
MPARPGRMALRGVCGGRCARAVLRQGAASCRAGALAVALVAGRWPQTRDTLLPLALVVLAGQGWMAWRVVADLSTGKTPPELVTPALYLPTVPGGFVGAMALQALGFHGWATLLMGMGLGAWALLEMRILNRLFAGPLPLACGPLGIGAGRALAAGAGHAASGDGGAGRGQRPGAGGADALALLERGAVQRGLLVVFVSAGGVCGHHGGAVPRAGRCRG